MTENKIENNFPYNCNENCELKFIKLENIQEDSIILPDESEPSKSNISSDNDCNKWTFTNLENVKDEVLLNKNELKPPKINQVFIQEYEEKEEEIKEPKRKRKKHTEKKHVCTFIGCKARFARLYLLRLHLCRHTGERPYPCDFKDCDRAFTNTSCLNKHKLTHTTPKQYFPCDSCELKFTTAFNLKKHCLRIHDNPLTIKPTNAHCDDCHLVFPTLKLFKIHMREKHNRKLYKCEFCAKIFAEPSILERHLKTNAHKTYECTICSISFSKLEYRKHNRLEHTEFQSDYTCDFCNKKFSHKSNLKLHLQDHNSSNVVVCPYQDCNRVYYYQKNLDIHVRCYHLGEKWPCPSCDLKLCSKQNLKSHIHKIHENPVPRKPPPKKKNRKRRRDIGTRRKNSSIIASKAEAENCQKNDIVSPEVTVNENEISSSNDISENPLLNPENIKNEVFLEENETEPEEINQVFVEEYKEEEAKGKKKKWKPREKKLPCTFPGCSFKFARPCDIIRHQCVHTGERPFTCDFEDCDKTFITKSHLNRHKLSHNRSPKPSYSCEVCEMKFFNQSNLKKHSLRLHGNPLNISAQSRSCEECNLVLPTRKLLKVHMNEKHDRKMYKCNFCTKTFSEPSILARHMKSNVHRIYDCKICSLSFSKSEFTKHNRMVHREFHSEYTCDICDKKFGYKTNLRHHLLFHVTSNVFECTFEGCKRVYNFQRNLDLHIRTFHLGVKWECSFCQAVLSTKQKLVNHIDKIHENPVPKKRTTENRKKRKDAGIPRKSLVSQLVGLILPPKVEKDILNRETIKFEADDNS